MCDCAKIATASLAPWDALSLNYSHALHAPAVRKAFNLKTSDLHPDKNSACLKLASYEFGVAKRAHDTLLALSTLASERIPTTSPPRASSKPKRATTSFRVPTSHLHHEDQRDNRDKWQPQSRLVGTTIPLLVALERLFCRRIHDLADRFMKRSKGPWMRAARRFFGEAARLPSRIMNAVLRWGHKNKSMIIAVLFSAATLHSIAFC